MKRKILVVLLILVFNSLLILSISKINVIMFAHNFVIIIGENNSDNSDHDDNPPINEEVKYDGEDYTSIGVKLEKYFVDTKLTGYGEIIAKDAINSGVNPYLIGAIILENTQCQTACSAILVNCNNVNDLKGTPGCFGGSYKKYDNVEDSIKELVEYIDTKFYANNKTSPSDIYSKYGKDVRWAYRVGQYMELIKKGN